MLGIILFEFFKNIIFCIFQEEMDKFKKEFILSNIVQKEKDELVYPFKEFKIFKSIFLLMFHLSCKITFVWHKAIKIEFTTW